MVDFWTVIKVYDVICLGYNYLIGYKSTAMEFFLILIRIDLNKFWIKNCHFLILYSYLKLIQINTIVIK